MSSAVMPSSESCHRPSTSVSRRSFTVPAKLAGSVDSRAINSPASEGKVEMLFTSPSTKVVSFSPPSLSALNSARGERDYKGLKGEAPDNLSWSSPTERTLASGMSRSMCHVLIFKFTCR